MKEIIEIKERLTKEDFRREVDKKLEEKEKYILIIINKNILNENLLKDRKTEEIDVQKEIIAIHKTKIDKINK